jgi:hypothetical protein
MASNPPTAIENKDDGTIDNMSGLSNPSAGLSMLTPATDIVIRTASTTTTDASFDTGMDITKCINFDTPIRCSPRKQYTSSPNRSSNQNYNETVLGKGRSPSDFTTNLPKTPPTPNRLRLTMEEIDNLANDGFDSDGDGAPEDASVADFKKQQ